MDPRRRLTRGAPSVSAFGFGGSNFHVALEEYVGEGRQAPRLRTSGTELVVLCGQTSAEVAAEARRVAQRLAACTGQRAGQAEFEWAAFSCSANFDATAPGSARGRRGLGRAAAQQARARRGGDRGQARGQLREPRRERVAFGSRRGDVALLFPGQGSQYVGMTGDLALRFESVRDAWDRAADLPLGPAADRPQGVPDPAVRRRCARSREVALRATEWAQPWPSAPPASGCSRCPRARDPAHGGRRAQLWRVPPALHAAGVIGEADVLVWPDVAAS